MQKAWNTDLKAFGQSYEKNDVMDSAVLIMPLVFFLHGVSGMQSVLGDERLTGGCGILVGPALP